jgi:glycosyltransferase involved in cell wall biosynthesis
VGGDVSVLHEPRFSIVIPAFDAAGTIAAAVRSVLLQSVASFEILVVDDGSTDGTAEIVERLKREDPRVHLFRQSRGGPAAARNHALRHAHGELVTFLDSDDLLLPDYLARMGATLDGSPETGFAYTDAWVLDDASGRVRRASAMSHRKPREFPQDPTRLLQLLLGRNFIFVATTVRAEAIEDVHGWRETMTPAEDYDLWLRLLAAGYPAVHVDDRLAVYRLRSGSNSSDPHRMLVTLANLYRDVVETWKVDDRSRRIARRRLLQTERWTGRLDPGRDQRSLRLAVSRIRANLRESQQWLDAPPAVVEEVLASTAEAAHPSAEESMAS